MNLPDIDTMRKKLIEEFPNLHRMMGGPEMTLLAEFVVRENNEIYNNFVVSGTRAAKCSPGGNRVGIKCDVPDCGGEALFIINRRALCGEHGPKFTYSDRTHTESPT